MKKQLKLLLLAALLIGYALPLWAQASTEGKEFWVALNMTTGTGGTDHSPFICITTQHPGGTYTITNPADPTFKTITGPIPPTGYIKINANMNPGANEIDLNKWYPVGQTAQAISNQTRNMGLKVTTTVESSVFVGNRLPQSFDAANILPITALQTDYITQDYPGYDHEDKGGGYPVTTILATENNTQVKINPASAVLNSTGTATITKTLNAGQVLYITGDNRATLSGTTITSDKKIAVFTGVNNTDVPGPVSARDHLYEQNMPVDYWGTHFVVTRSMRKDANRIRVTASNNGTDISVDGNYLTTINAGETYEFELCSATMRSEEGYTKADAEHRGTERYFTGYAHYLETSCPCAVFSYDVSENYYIKKNGTSERDESAHGDPAMVWISPLEQQLRKVTFGVMNTDQTPTHYVNIITPTNGAASLEVREIAMSAGKVVYGNNLVQAGDVQPVPGNPTYSYARIKLVEDAESVYTITSGVGFIAHVYGSGNKESYAYSCGSAAVQQGVKVNGVTFTNGFRSEDKFCLEDIFNFDAKVGTDEITRVDWNFGDGTSEYFGSPQTSHQYSAPGWYDVTADLYGHQVCTDEDEVNLGSVSFSFLIVVADTVLVDPQERLLTREQIKEILAKPGGREHLDSLVNYGEATIINPDAPCYEDKQLSLVIYRVECLELGIKTIEGEPGVCPGEDLPVSYSLTKGSIKDIDDDGNNAILRVPGQPDQAFTIPNQIENNGTLTLPTGDITKSGYYKAQIVVEDEYCNNTYTLPIEFTVYYPENIMKYKFNNIMAIYKPGYGGNEGYEFSNYEWHLIRGEQDSIVAAGPECSVLYLGERVTFEVGDKVYVVLTEKSGSIGPLRSCEYKIDNVPSYDPEPNQAPSAATKRIVNRQIIIEKDSQSYNIYGQRVE